MKKCTVLNDYETDCLDADNYSGTVRCIQRTAEMQVWMLFCHQSHYGIATVSCAD